MLALAPTATAFYFPGTAPTSYKEGDADRIPEAAAAIANIPGVSEVYSVTGGVDLIAMVRVREHEELADIIADRVSKVDGVVRTQTFIAFRTYSQHDLEQAFALGIED